MILFEKIRWKNFLSTGNQYIEIILNKDDNTLIVGTNGAGKSTVLDALTFSLFGKPFRKINKAQLINTTNEKDCMVEVELTIGTTEWKVVRGVKPNKFEIYRNDDGCYIILEDNGPGIPEKNFEDVFKPFFTLDPSRNKLKGESGLGLSITRDIIRSHGGEIKLDKSKLGGLKSIIQLPI